jgi:hypothetical protein
LIDDLRFIRLLRKAVMADFRLLIKVTEQGTNTPIVGAIVTGTVCGLDAYDQPVDAVSGADGFATFKGLYLTVTAEGFEDYAHQLHRRPALQEVVRVFLRRRA